MDKLTEIIRSGFPIEGPRLFCEFNGRFFLVQSRFQRYHKTPDIHEALVVFEGLCQVEFPMRRHAKSLIVEARRNQRFRFVNICEWEKRVLECAKRRDEGFRPLICGSKCSLEKWIPVASS